MGLGPICTGCRGPWRPGSKRGKTRRPRGAQEGNEAACRVRAAARAAPPFRGRGIISPALSSHPRTTWHNIFYLVAEAARFRFLFVEQALLASGRRQIFWDRWADFLREGSRSHLRNGFVQPLVVVVLDEASEGLHPRSPFAVHPVGTVPPLKRERRCGRLEPSWLPPCTWACDCLGRFSSPVTSSTLRCVGFAPPGERLAQTLPVDHRDRQPGSCRSLAGSCSYSRIADLRVLSRF